MKQRNTSWVFSLLSEKFFNPCHLHQHFKKNEKNVFCLDCCITICPHCLILHPSHRLLQVRRYVYHDVVRLDDLEKLFDCSLVQSYITNNSKVVFLNHRPQTRPIKCPGSVCNSCERSLQEPYRFCSLACKVQYVISYEGCISPYLYDCEYLSPPDDLGCTHLEEYCQMTPSSVLDHTTSSSTSGSSCNDDVGCVTVGCTAMTENVTRKKRSNMNRVAAGSVYYRNTPRIVSKRKGVPLRSPMY